MQPQAALRSMRRAWLFLWLAQARPWGELLELFDGAVCLGFFLVMSFCQGTFQKACPTFPGLTNTYNRSSKGRSSSLPEQPELLALH